MTMQPNDYFWWLPDHAGRLFWIPLVAYGAVGMYYLYKLAAPATRLGRVIRVTLSLAFMSMIFTPILNGLGPWAMHLLAIGTVLVVYQVYQGCLASGKIIKPTDPALIVRIADRVSQPVES